MREAYAPEPDLCALVAECAEAEAWQHVRQQRQLVAAVLHTCIRHVLALLGSVQA